MMLFAMLLSSNLVFAQNNEPAREPDAVAVQVSGPTENTAVSAEERMKVKKRLYPGGRDEESLQVQPQLASPSRATISPDEMPDNDAD